MMRTKMKDRAKVIMLGIAMLLLGLIASGGPAYAVSCTLSAGSYTNSAGSICTVELTYSNITQLNGAVDLQVTWDNTTGTTLGIQWISGGPGTPKAISEFGYNNSTDTVSQSGGGLNADWTFNQAAGGGPCGSVGGNNIDGFGCFLTDDQRPDGTYGVSSPIVFTLASQITSIGANDNDSHFAAHISWGTPDCSGFVSDAPSTSVTSNSNCGTTQVPEPTSLILLGSGLAGLGLWGRKRFKGI